jgi:Fe2+ transport system protein FeoA
VTTLPVATAPTAGAAVVCPLCGLEYEPGDSNCQASGCPIAFGSCATRHCPRCGYTMPDEEKSAAARLVRRLLARRPKHAAGTLADLPAGGHGVIETIGGDPGLQARLTAQGLAPGVPVHVVQRVPTFVVEVGETTLGLEHRVAAAVKLRQS